MIFVSFDESIITKIKKKKIKKIEITYVENEVFVCLNKALSFIYCTINSNIHRSFESINIMIEFNEFKVNASLGKDFIEYIIMPYTKFDFLFGKIRYDLIEKIGMLDFVKAVISRKEEKYTTFDFLDLAKKYGYNYRKAFQLMENSYVYVDEYFSFIVAESDVNVISDILREGKDIVFENNHPTYYELKKKIINRLFDSYLDNYEKGEIFESKYFIKDIDKKVEELIDFFKEDKIESFYFQNNNINEIIATLFYRVDTSYNDIKHSPKDEIIPPVKPVPFVSENWGTGSSVRPVRR